ncbi:MAG TPA: hypothetical protein VM711_04040, partial [Sphingomicrobium sp.]|nr:hypothetical protein [Sphingomicrobium sp.]
KAGSGEASPAADALKRARAGEPKPLAGGNFEVDRGTIILVAPRSAHLNPQRARFFPDENGYWNAVRARVVSRKPLRIAGRKEGRIPKQIKGVLSDGSAAYHLTFRARPSLHPRP